MTTYQRPVIWRLGRHLLSALGALALMTGTGAAQVGDAAASEWSHGTTLSVFVGAGRDDGDLDAVGALGVGWEIAPHFTVEARGTWFRPGADATVYSASVNAVHVVPVYGLRLSHHFETHGALNGAPASRRQVAGVVPEGE